MTSKPGIQINKIPLQNTQKLIAGHVIVTLTTRITRVHMRWCWLQCFHLLCK